MKKLCIIIPAILVATILYSADTSSITVNLCQKTGILYYNSIGLKFNQLNLNSETFESLAQKIYDRIKTDEAFADKDDLFYNSRPNKKLLIKKVNIEIQKFEWHDSRRLREYSPNNSTTLSTAGLRNEAYIIAILTELKELEPHEEIKEPDLDYN